MSQENVSAVSVDDSYSPDKKFRFKREADKAHYDHETVHGILDEGFVAHLGYGAEAGPQVIPTYYVRDGERLLIHVSSKSGMARAAKAGVPMCATVTLLDGLVMARSGFHHSMLFRTVCVHGTPTLLEGDDKHRALDLMVERLSPGRAALARPANTQEFKATLVFALPLEQVVAKVSAGGPNDDAADLELPIWAGQVRFTQEMVFAASADMQVDVEAPEISLVRKET
ncbi:MAG: nitroimidazol reductase NimA-like FMN-containing flavoprotein [Parvibaculaceae bacterium]|jgi:nitroimidazol reductase NimA-like FMN-containing flavoprotein (pyridoxamine 5'-phosphate oxidase superfamily)